jgi:hypothetical protein
MRTFSIGDLVLIRAMRPPADVAQGEKFFPHWNGPYKVIFAYQNGVSYRLADLKDPEDTWIEHVNNMKKYLAPRNATAGSAIPPRAETETPPAAECIGAISTSIPRRNWQYMAISKLVQYATSHHLHHAIGPTPNVGYAISGHLMQFPPSDGFRQAET